MNDKMTIDSLLRTLDEHRRRENPPTLVAALAEEVCDAMSLRPRFRTIEMEPVKREPVALLMGAPVFVSSWVPEDHIVAVFDDRGGRGEE